jgi:hypothetical protein
VQILKVLREAVTPVALLILVAVTVWGHYHPANPLPAPEPSPHAVRPDPAVVKLGTDYGDALLHAAADTLETSASRPWNSTAQAAQQNLEDFDDRLAKAWKPVASELSRRFGPTSDQQVDFAKGAEVRQFWRDLATGIRKEAK